MSDHLESGASPASISHGSVLAAAYGDRARRLVDAIQELSLARDLDAVMRIVRSAARELTGADGATFVLRDGDRCHYADESAIAPLWKGLRFPMSACISGWAMLARRAAVIEDIYADPRIPVDAYRPTFVKSLAMVPIRTASPIGAIGNYWAARHRPTDEEVALLQALADSTSIALENVRLYEELEHRVRQRTAELEAANRELRAYTYSVSHDLKSPLQTIGGYAQLLAIEQVRGLDARGRGQLVTIAEEAFRMGRMIDDLLRLSHVEHAELRLAEADLSDVARDEIAALRHGDPLREVEVVVADHLPERCDVGLVRIVLANLFANAWKFTRRTPSPRIEFGVETPQGGCRTYFVRDNGAGFDPALAGRLFSAFERLHTQEEFAGSGIGLATARRAIERHGGVIAADGAPGAGATFRFTLG